MFWVIATCLLWLVIAGAVITMIGAKEGDTKFFAGLWAAGCLIVWLALSVGLSVHRVQQRQVGIVYNFTGEITGKVDTGVAWTMPYQHITKENIGLQKEEFILGEANSAVSLDQQPIFADVQLNYQVEPEQVVELYKKVGPQWKSILLEGRMLQVFKETTAAFTAAETTSKRPQLREKAKAAMAEELKPYDIRVVDVLVKNLSYTQSYTDAINEKNVQVQASLQAQAKVAQARAEANQVIAAARGEAEAIRLRGQALRNNPSVLRLEAINKLNPAAQIVFCSSGDCPSFLPQAITAAEPKPTQEGK